MDFVLDCSMVMTWLFEDEFTRSSQLVRDRLKSQTAVVPALWRNEVVNTLIVGERRRRLNHAAATAFLEMLEELPIVVDPEESWRTVRDAWRLGSEHGLSAYDSAYLEIALRYSVPLATNDAHLKKAIAKLGMKSLKPARER